MRSTAGFGRRLQADQLRVVGEDKSPELGSATGALPPVHGALTALSPGELEALGSCRHRGEQKNESLCWMSTWLPASCRWACTWRFAHAHLAFSHASLARKPERVGIFVRLSFIVDRSYDVIERRSSGCVEDWREKKRGNRGQGGEQGGRHRLTAEAMADVETNEINR